MKVGDLVKLREGFDVPAGTLAVVVNLSDASIMFPRIVVDVMLNDGTCLQGISANMLEVVTHENKQGN